MIKIISFIFLIIIFFNNTCYANIVERKYNTCFDFPGSYIDFDRDSQDGIISEKNVNAFFTSLKSSPYCINKMIKIGVNGAWDADAVNVFQYKSIAFFNKETSDSCKALNNYKTEDRQSYFRFLLDTNSSKKNKINASMIYKKCSINIYKDFILANKTYDLISKIDDEGERPSIQRYDLNFFNKNKQKIYLIKDMDFNNDGFVDKIIVTVDLNRENSYRRIIFLQNFGDNTYFILQDNDDIFKNQSLSKVNFEIRDNQVVFYFFSDLYKKTIFLSYSEDKKIFLIKNVNQVLYNKGLGGQIFIKCEVKENRFFGYNGNCN